MPGTDDPFRHPKTETRLQALHQGFPATRNGLSRKYQIEKEVTNGNIKEKQLTKRKIGLDSSSLCQYMEGVSDDAQEVYRKGTSSDTKCQGSHCKRHP